MVIIANFKNLDEFMGTIGLFSFADLVKATGATAGEIDAVAESHKIGADIAIGQGNLARPYFLQGTFRELCAALVEARGKVRTVAEHVVLDNSPTLPGRFLN